MQQVLGSGAQATVYQALAKKTQRKTAVKARAASMTALLSITCRVLRGVWIAWLISLARPAFTGRFWTRRSWKTTIYSTPCAWRS